MDANADMNDPHRSAHSPAAGEDGPSVFVITPCRNAESTIATTIESVLSQQRLARHVVVDGGSADGTMDIIRSFALRDGRLSYISEPDEGIYDAMNKGIRRCLDAARPHDLIATLNADDAYLPGALETVARVAVDDAGADLLYGDVEEWDAQGKPTGRAFHAPGTLTAHSASDGMPIAHPAMFVRARAFRSLGLYDTGYRIAADYEFVLRALDARTSSRHVPRVLAAFRRGGVSTSQEIASYREAIRARVAHGASPFAEWSRFYKRRLFARAFALLRWIPGVASLQRRFGTSARNADWTTHA